VETWPRLAKPTGGRPSLRDLDQLQRVCGYRLSRPQRATNDDEAEVLALYRQVRDDERSTVKRMLLGLAVPPTQHASSGRSDASAKRRRDAIRQLEGDRLQHGENGPDETLPVPYASIPVWSFIESMLRGRPLVAQSVG
jgi:hypothetical protein